MNKNTCLCPKAPGFPRFFKGAARIIIVLIAIAASVAAMCSKDGWHIDEIATLGLANGSQAGYITAYDDAKYGRGAFIRDHILGDNAGEMIENVKGILSDIAEKGLSGFSIRDQYVAYRETSEPVWKKGSEFAEYLRADGFSVRDVYLNQALDTHPPVYYLFVRAAYALHSALGGGFSLWPAYFVNALFLALSCLLLMHIGEKRFGSFALGTGAALFFALSPAGLSLAVYMRMYMTLCFFLLLSLDAHLALMQNKWQFTRKISWYIALTCALGFMTHYYFAIWAVFMAAACFVSMLLSRCGRRVLPYIGRMASGVALSLVLWPFSAVHLLLSNRSAEAVGALSGGAFEKLASSFAIFRSHLFGAPVFVPIALVLLCAAVLSLHRAGKLPFSDSSPPNTPVALVFFPAALYLLVVFVISPYEDLRYMACAVPLIAMCAAWCIWQAARLCPCDMSRTVACALLCAAVALSGLATQSPMYLYPGTQEVYDAVNAHSGKKCVYLTSSGAAFFREMPLLSRCDEVLIVNRGEMRILAGEETIAGADEILLFIHDSYPQTDAMHAVLELTGFSDYEVLAQSHAGLDARAYLLKK